LADIPYFRDILASPRRHDELGPSGAKVVGTLCNFVPEEIILALGAVPLRLCSGDHVAARNAEDSVPVDLCPAAKATVGLLRAGEGFWGRLDLLVVPTSCDAKTKLPDLVGEEATVYRMLLPRSKRDDGARRSWLEQTRRFAAEMERVAGRKLTVRALRGAIDLLNARQEAARRLLALRTRPLPPITGEETLIVFGASFLDDPKRWTEQANALCAALEAEPEAPTGPAPKRMLLTGAPLVYPNLKLVRLIEGAGAVVVADDLCSGTERLYHPVTPREWSLPEMLRAIAERYLLPTTCPCFAESDDRVNRLLSLAEEFQADGAVYHNLRMCPLFDIESRRVASALRDAGVPTLVLHTDYSPEDTAQLRTRVEAFLEMLGP
jgi:benzoyl-CoA reductase/2-hydroxyglutaryl-CoA dehydratase subunit BcrC/BadD/HgdB